VKLVTIGMHVGGGPYDEPTKEPMKRSVEPRFPDLARCWSELPAPPAPGVDVGVDLVIEAKGGRARVQNPRVSGTSKRSGLEACIVSFFESVEFLPPKNGKTVVSYSIRVTPQKP
jgi:hypothetical protein